MISHRLHGLHDRSHRTLNVRELFSRPQVPGAILKAPFSNFVKEVEPGTWIPLRVFILCNISVTDRK